MRKTSQDGGDTTSITSGTENEVKKSTTGLAKIKRSSIKKRVQSFSHESDDGVIEPLLQKDKDKTEFPSQCAKISKTKTDVAKDIMDDKGKLLPDIKVEKLPLTSFSDITEKLTNGTKEGHKSYSCTASAIHNHMNANIFNNSDAIKNPAVTKSQIFVEIDGIKQGGYSSGPLIFTTAKIHTDGKPMQMEPVQVTPVPILSTVEGSVINTSSVVDNQKVNLGTSRKSSSILSTDVASEEINVDSNLKTSPEIISGSKQEPTFSRSVGLPGFPKVSSEDKKGFSNAFNSKLPNLFTSAEKIGDSNVMTTAASKIMPMQVEETTSDKPSLVKKDVLKVSGKGSIIGIKQKIDVNKSFQLPTCSTLPITNSVIVKDVAGMDKMDSSNIKELQRQTNTIEDIYSNPDTKKNRILHDTKTAETEKNRSNSKTNIVAADNNAKNEISNISGITTTQDKILIQVPVTISVTITNSSTDKLITTVPTIKPTKISTAPTNITQTSTTIKQLNIKTTTIINSAVGKITTSTLSSASITNSPVAMTAMSSVSKNSIDLKSRMSTKVESSNNTGTSKTAPKSITPVSYVKEESGAILAGKPTTKPTLSESIITLIETSTGKTPLSTSKTTITSSSITSIGSLPKYISTATPTNASSNNIGKSNTVIPNKLKTSKDQVTGTSSKIHIFSPVSCSVTTESTTHQSSTKESTTKPSTSAVSKTPQNISSSKTPVTSTKLAETTMKTINGNQYPSTSAMSFKTSNVEKTSDNLGVSTKGSIKSTSSTVLPAAVVTTTSQKSSTMSINKSFDLRSSEHIKEKLK